jgi:capsular exopolysaccharide synthesis family protein
MGFFYQALKKAAGVPTSPTEELVEREQPTFDEDLRDRTVAAPAKAKPHRKLSLKFPLESLVAFLSPPVEDANVIAMEQCRVLRARIWETMRQKNFKSLLVTSAMPAEGKTLLSVNLAFALSQIENVRVLLVDVDLRRPGLARFLGLMPDKGLNSFLKGGESFDDVCWSLNETLDFVPTQPVEEDSAELLHGQQMIEFLREAKQRYDVVVMDAPPLFPIVDAQVLAPLVDAAVMVVRAGQTSFELSRQGADLLKGKLIGSILNGAEISKRSGYYGGYYGRYGKTAKKKKKK